MRRRLLGAIVGVAAAAVVLFAVPLGIVLEHAYRDDALLRLQRDAVANTRAIDLSGSPGDPIELPRSPGTTLAVYDRAGRRVAGAGPLRADALTTAALRSGRVTDAQGDGRVTVAVPLLSGERVDGAVRAARSTAAAARDARAAWTIIAAVGGGVIVLASLAALILSRRLARPVERLAPAAGRLGDGDFSARAPRAGIAEVDAVAAALDATAQRLDDLLARERAFSDHASHQLRTPLAALRLELEALDLRGASAPELDAALAQVERLQETIDTLLAFGRDTSAGGTTDVRALLDDADERWHGPLAAEGRPLRIDAGRPASARIAPGVAREIVDVLVDNARRHGRGPVTLTLRELDGRSLAIDVRDEGEGFAENGDDPFARVRDDARADGHGIGLALARALAEAEGARLSITRAGSPTVMTLLVAA